MKINRKAETRQPSLPDRAVFSFAAVFFIYFCGTVFAQDVFEAKDKDETKTSGDLMMAGDTAGGAGAADRPGAEKQPEPGAKPDEKKPLTAGEMQNAFEKALKSVDAGRLEEEKKLEEVLHTKFRICVEEWLDAARRKRALDMNRMMNQDWEKVFEFGPFIHYDYYLRDFEMLEKGSDIIKTDSVLTPYKGYMDVSEKLYVEKYHTPDISYIDDFLYTVTYPVKVNIEYRGGGFVLVNDEYGQPSIEKGWPAHVRSKLRERALGR